MDTRTLSVSLAFIVALLGGVAVGWWQGLPQTQGATVSGEVVIPESLPATVAPTPIDVAPDVTGYAVEPAAQGSESDPYDGDIFAIGDSVLAGAAACLDARGYEVDVQQSRRISQAIGILAEKAEWLPSRILVHLGTNGGATPAELDAIMEMLGPQRLVMWSTIQLPDDPTRYTYERATNEAIADLAQRYDNVRIFDWEAMSQQHPDWIYLEGIHMTPEGCEGYAGLVDPQLRAP